MAVVVTDDRHVAGNVHPRSREGHQQAGALRDVDADMAVNSEHEDLELGPLEGLEVAARTLRAAASQAI
ncbi:hypothetical protein OG698_03805 [Streptomyces sp. NBC_01003]|uniref:hypothetical protein n=1 Tax=Streptomyces sp. NBC_01003 TaxID=2903714 RepID=UPI00386BBE80|nr:hypothetical protein OG698_03805 [Streptomyces sp. NBC_01003]